MLEVTKMLLSYGADIRMQCRGRTPFELAVLNGNKEVARILSVAEKANESKAID
jgi:hypothetical protein